MELIFLGTRGEIDVATRRHRRHSALLIVLGPSRIMIDCGADWLGKFEALQPTAIFVSHAHPDHAWGLANGARCPVYATRETFALLADSLIADRRPLSLRTPIRIGRLTIEAFRVIHSIRAPAVGFRITGSGSAFFYVPDLVAIRERAAALRGVQLYIGDGATITRPLIRWSQGTLIGHTPIRTQLGWCQKEGVPRAIFTHCGTEIVAGDSRSLSAEVRNLGRARGINSAIAHDGERLLLKRGRIVGRPACSLRKQLCLIRTARDSATASKHHRSILRRLKQTREGEAAKCVLPRN